MMKLNSLDGFTATRDQPALNPSLRGVNHLEAYHLTADSLLYLCSWQKRFLDLVGAFVGILIGFPVFFVAALLVKAIDRVPILFFQERFGLNGEAFTLYKLRTLNIIEDRNRVDIARIQVKPVYETTPTGKLWRVTSIDEIIQFWLVMKGEMTLVGHRPLPMYYIRHLDKIDGMDERKLQHYLRIVRQYKPGMSSLSSINGRGDLTMQQKFEYDLIYAQNACFWYDIKILLQTLVVVMTQKGAK